MAENTAAVTDAAEEETVVTEEPEAIAEPALQDAEAKYDQYVALLRQAEETLAETTARLKSERDAAVEEAKKWESTYKGLQRESTPKLQEYSTLKKQVQEQAATLGRLDRMEALLNEVATQLLPDDQVQRFNIERERAQLAAERAALEASAHPVSSEVTETEDQRKERLLRQYFPGSTVSHTDPRLDWAVDAPSLDAWVARMSASIITAERNSVGDKVAAEAEELSRVAVEKVSAAEELAAQKLSEARKQLEEDRVRIREEARLEKEAQLRNMGVDVSDNALPEGNTQQPRRTLQEALNINEKELIKVGNPKGIMQLEKALDAQRNRIRSRLPRNPQNNY